MPGTLYLVSTPIGNLGDISLRQIETLKTVDFIAAEDTRVSQKLLNHLQIKKPLVSYYEHNKTESGARIISRLLQGQSCALMTDAGTPAISDPGESIVALCALEGIQVIPVPGCCAAIAALSVSGLPTQRFCFEGFLSTSRKSRFRHLDEVKDETRSLVFYEAPHKLMATLQDMLRVFGDREVSISREITKLYEETLRLTLSQAIDHFSETQPKGEFVLVIKGAEVIEKKLSAEEAGEILTNYRSQGKSLKEASRLAADETGFSKNELYQMGVKGDRD